MIQFTPYNIATGALQAPTARSDIRIAQIGEFGYQGPNNFIRVPATQLIFSDGSTAYCQEAIATLVANS
jgi:hypothetical protein